MKQTVLINLSNLSISVAFYQNILAAPTECALKSDCIKTNESEVCLLEDGACIRKYPSKCHMEIAACMQGTGK